MPTTPPGLPPRPSLSEVVNTAARTPAANEPDREPVMYTVSFWKRVGERALKTFAQTMVAALGVGATGMVDLDWSSLGALSAAAAIASVLTSLAGVTGPASDAENDRS